MKKTSTWLAITAAGGVLAFGAVQPLTILLVECAVAAIALAEFWSEDLPRVPKPALIVLLVLGVLPLLQIIPLTQEIAQILAPLRSSAYRQVLGPGQLPAAFFPISVQTYATFEAWLRASCYLLVFLLAVSWEERRLPSVLPTFLVGLGLFEAVYGLVQYLTGVQYIFAYAKRYYLDEATGTYINRNHYAGFLEMVLPFLLAMILLPSSGFHVRERKWASFFTDTSFAALRQILAFAVAFLALVFSRSRMGILSAAVAMIVVAALAVLRRGRRAWPAVAVVIAVVLTYAGWIGISPVTERFEKSDPRVLDSLRVEIWKDAAQLVRENPFFGAGLGTYYTISPRYQSHFFQYRVDHPHNDYLELAAELGVPAAILLFGSLWWLTIRLAASIRLIERRSDLILAVGCCGALISLLLHSFTDFNMQIAANALLLSWIAGTGAGLLGRLRRPVSESRGL